jgi:hypothetical protein
MLGATSGQLVYGRDMPFDLSFKANWKNFKEWKMARIEDSNQRENAKQISHTYRVGDLVSKDRNQLQPKLHRPCDGPHTIDKVYTNGTLKIRKGITSEKISICRVNLYHTFKKQKLASVAKNNQTKTSKCCNKSQTTDRQLLVL